jgi:hypothetical protein
MELLVTLIGNAAVDPFFRKRFLDSPVDTVDEYGFRLTKGDFEIMEAMFANLTATEKADVERAFVTLENWLYRKLESKEILKCGRPCLMSIYPPGEPHELRKERPAA